MLGSGNILNIINEADGSGAFRVSFNGADITENFIAHDKLMRGGTLRFYTEV